MSELFRKSPKCYGLILALENEHYALREANQKYTLISFEEDKKYREQRALTKLRMRRADAREIRHVNFDSIRRLRKEHEDAELARARARVPVIHEYEYPGKPVSKDWPVRPNSAQRLLSPGKLTDLHDYADVVRLPADQPLIHGTGVPAAPMKPPLRRREPKRA
jgi:hypothetical protein